MIRADARSKIAVQIEATQHDLLIDEDYALIAEADLLSAREAIRWPLVDRGGGRYDFSTVQPIIAAALRRGIEPIWDLFHYGYPAGVDLFGSEFPRRFAAYWLVEQAVRLIRKVLPRNRGKPLPGPPTYKAS